MAWTTAIRQALLLVMLAAVPAIVTAFWHPRSPVRVAAAGAAHEVTVTGLRGWSELILWIDARPAADFTQARIPGALSLQETSWERDLPAVLEAWRPEMKVVVYCGQRDCAASERVAQRLRQDLGHDDVYFLAGGFEAWQKRGE